MPGWHEATNSLRDEGKVRMVGILQEQHPQRARLFMQWKQMDWPLLVDSMNLLGVAVVPITVLVDEHGIVRHTRPKASDVEGFLATKYEVPKVLAPKPEALLPRKLQAATRDDPSAEDWRAYARSIVLWGEPEGLSTAIDAFSEALELEPDHPATHFQLGVAYRHLYDSRKKRSENIFQQAVDHWTRALELNPNQYIWRRRIQQYGPRLKKPYPFYDWVDQAQAEVVARGETLVKLAVALSGAEYAQPAKSFESAEAPREPDPEGRIHRDERGFIHTETVVVPARIEAGSPGRVHLVFRPNQEIQAHWNNEADDMELWIDPPAGWRVDRRHHMVANPPELTSLENRRIEFEIQSPEDARGSLRVPAYALYYVCEDVDGTCLYRRRDLEIEVEVVGP